MKLHLLILLAGLLLTGCSGSDKPAVSSTPEVSASAPAILPQTPSAPVLEPEKKEEPAQKVEMEFTGTVLALTPTTVLVKVDEDCALYQSSDQVTFSVKPLEKIEIAEGDRVKVGCTGNIQETYPAQVGALTWELLPAVEWAEMTIVYDESGDSMSVTLPAGWAAGEFDILDEGIDAGLDPTAEIEPVVSGHVIAFWPEENPECRVELSVRPQRLGICGTGVTSKERIFERAGAATVYSEEHTDGVWYHIVFAVEDGRYSAQWNPTHDQLASYEETFWQIMNAITVGNEV